MTPSQTPPESGNHKAHEDGGATGGRLAFDGLVSGALVLHAINAELQRFPARLSTLRVQEVVPVMTDEHALDLADDLYGTCGDKPARLAVMRFFNRFPGWTPSDVTAGGVESVSV